MSVLLIKTQDILGTGAACSVIITPGDTPYVDGDSLTLNGRRSLVLASNGTGLIDLQTGRYTVTFRDIPGELSSVSVDIPDDDDIHLLSDLITGGTGSIAPANDYVRKSRNLADLPDKAAAFAAIKQPATTEATGVLALATPDELAAGLVGNKAVSPQLLAAALAALQTLVDGGICIVDRTSNQLKRLYMEDNKLQWEDAE